MTREEKIEKLLSKGPIEFELENLPDRKQLIKDVINVLSGRGVTVEQAVSVLEDVSAIIKAVTEI